MPTYQYSCTGCAEQMEVVQKFTDDPLTECAVCGSRLRKVFSPVGIVFKGSGFYRTDSRAASNGGGNGSKGESKDTEQSSSGESASADSGGQSSKSEGSTSSGDSKASDSGASTSSDSGSGKSGAGDSGGKRTEKVT